MSPCFSLLESCKKLYFLDLSFCNSVEDEAVVQFRQEYPHCDIKRSFQDDSWSSRACLVKYGGGGGGRGRGGGAVKTGVPALWHQAQLPGRLMIWILIQGFTKPVARFSFCRATKSLPLFDFVFMFLMLGNQNVKSRLPDRVTNFPNECETLICLVKYGREEQWG